MKYTRILSCVKTRTELVVLSPPGFTAPEVLFLTSSRESILVSLFPQSASAKGGDGDDLDPETDALTDLNTQDSQADRGTARPSVSSTRGNRCGSW